MLNYNFLLDKYCPELRCDCINNTYDAITCYDPSVEKPTKEQFEEWWKESEDEYYVWKTKKEEISNSRKSEYPSVEELVIALWERVIENNEELSAEVQKRRMLVKEKYQHFSPEDSEVNS
jgi:hypothetical protein